MTTKICSKCKTEKPVADYYRNRGRPKAECKKCTIRRNVAYQHKNRTWITKFPDEESRKLYMRNYYAEHKKKFAEYRATFKKKHPNYFKDWYRKTKE